MTRNILVIRLGSLGDVILTSSAILNLKLAHADSRLTFLTKQKFAEIAARIPGVDAVLTLPEPAGARDLYRLVLQLDAQNFDIIIDLHGNFRSWFVRTLVTSQQKSVYPKRRLERWLTVHRQQFPKHELHTIDLYNSAVEQLGIPIPSRRPVIATSTPAHATLGTPRENMIVIAPGAAHTNKKWPLERFLEIARVLIKEHDAKISWVVTAEDAGKCQFQNWPADSFTEIVDAPISAVADLMAQARLTIANDSGLAHLSSAVGTPVIAIFGPTHPALGFAPRGQFDSVVQVDEFCRPCSLHGKKPCYRSERFCMTQLSEELVLSAVSRILESNINSQRALFIDRDGTLCVDKYYTSDPDKIELIPGVAQAMRRAKDAGFKLVVVSNQSGVARGLFGIEAVERTNDRMKELLAKEGVQLDRVLYCPHHRLGVVPEYRRACHCRKPASGMPERAAIDLGIDLRRSYVIGDKTDDINMATIIGCSAVLVRTGYGVQSEVRLEHAVRPNAYTVCNDLAQAIDWILNRSTT